MRFQDFDVLLFPAGSHVPLREFKTACYAQRDNRTMTVTPLLTSFVPSLPAGSPFQISVHSWNKPESILGSNDAGYVAGTTYQWRVKVLIEGATTATELLPEDVTWPCQINNSYAQDAGGKAIPLSFPRFHKSMLKQARWSACDDLGRIKVQLSAGYEALLDGKPKFVKLVDHIIFSFQPAPLDILEQTGIAWPNPNLPIANNPLQPAEPMRRGSVGSGVPGLDESSSRSTSAYSTVPSTAYPPLDISPASGGKTLYMPETMHNTTYGHQPPQMIRLPSDQLQKIIDAISPATRKESISSMPPPPIPHRRQSSDVKTPIMDRRAANYSDISMHTTCTSFPTCMTEDDSGCLFHNTAAVPATTIRSKKEGESSPSKRLAAQRDFLSTVLDVPAPKPVATPSKVATAAETLQASSPGMTDSSTKKRTRSALGKLTINDGSPEKKEKPARKMSRISAHEEDKENIMTEV